MAAPHPVADASRPLRTRHRDVTSLSMALPGGDGADLSSARSPISRERTPTLTLLGARVVRASDGPGPIRIAAPDRWAFDDLVWTPRGARLVVGSNHEPSCARLGRCRELGR